MYANYVFAVSQFAHLEPYFDLSFCEVEQVSDLYPPPARQVVVVVELLLQLQRLEPAVRLTSPAPWATAGA